MSPAVANAKALRGTARKVAFTAAVIQNGRLVLLCCFLGENLSFNANSCHAWLLKLPPPCHFLQKLGKVANRGAEQQVAFDTGLKLEQQKHY
jgi:hypothetical protein